MAERKDECGEKQKMKPEGDPIQIYFRVGCMARFPFSENLTCCLRKWIVVSRSKTEKTSRLNNYVFKRIMLKICAQVVGLEKKRSIKGKYK